MTLSPGPALESLPAFVFQFSANRLELLNRELPVEYAGLTFAKLSKILRGEWRKLIPEEFHPVVQRLAALSKMESHTTVEFPVFWMGNTIWLRIFAARVARQKHKMKIIGLAQDVTIQRQLASETDSPAEHTVEEDEDHWRKLRHNINSSLTTILMNCELLLDNSCAPGPRQRIAAILSEALKIDQHLQHYR